MKVQITHRYDGTVVSAQMAFKGITSSDFVCNAGTFQAFKSDM